MRIVKPPNSIEGPRPWVFLAGSIEMGEAERWQDKVCSMLKGFNGTVLNPRRDDWDSSWDQNISNPKFREQVCWELKAQEEADLVLCYFAPGTQSPITLLELGLFWEKMVVCCPEGYWRKGDVDVVCQRYGIRQVGTVEELLQVEMLQ